MKGWCCKVWDAWAGAMGGRWGLEDDCTREVRDTAVNWDTGGDRPSVQAATAAYGPTSAGSHSKVKAVEAINAFLFGAVLSLQAMQDQNSSNPGYISVASRHELHRKEVWSFEAE